MTASFLLRTGATLLAAALSACATQEQDPTPFSTRYKTPIVEAPAHVACLVHAPERRKSEPVGGLRVEICSRVATSAPWMVVATGETDTHGDLVIDARPFAPVSPEAAPELLARLAEDGWIEASKVLKPKASARSREVTLEAHRGITFHGRLVDSGGAGVPGDVQLAKRIRGRPLGGGKSATTGPDGHFVMHAYDFLFDPEEPGNLPVVLGFAEGRGTLTCMCDEVILLADQPTALNNPIPSP